MTGLQSLTLSMSKCARLANIDGLQGLAGLTELRSLSLDLAKCVQLTSVDALRSLRALTALQALTLNLSDQICFDDPGEGVQGGTLLLNCK